MNKDKVKKFHFSRNEDISKLLPIKLPKFRYILSSDSKSFLKGMFVTLFILCLFGLVFAVGFHTADEILGGKFQGNYEFNGTLDLTNANVVGGTGGVLKDSNLVCNSTNEGLLKYNSSLKEFYGCRGDGWRKIDLGIIEGEIGGNDANTVLLLHCDDFTDSSVSAHSVGTNGNVAISGLSKFGSSCSFDGADDYLQFSDSDDWNLGSGDFTIDTWVYFNSLGNTEAIVTQWEGDGGTDRAWQLYKSASDTLGFSVRDSSATLFIQLYGSTVLEANRWYHIAVVRKDSTATIYLDGQEELVDISAAGTIVDSTYPLLVGMMGMNAADTRIYDLNGYIDELRISKGVARWSGPFTPNLIPYS